jgi:predicted nucleic acid-binding protein
LRVLIDTNIIIHRENYHVLPKDLQELMKTLSTLKAELLIHPKSIEEIRNDLNKQRKEISLSKMSTYTMLDSPPDPLLDISFLNAVGGTKVTNPHDQVDSFMLYAVYRNAVNYLISEDKEIHKKAAKVGLRARVLSCQEALEVLQAQLPKENVEHPPALKWESVYNLNIDDPFFDSLKQEYPDFKTWFEKISTAGRKCYVHFEGERISALLILKDENERVDSNPPLPTKRRLKLCTFKGESSGNRIGELFIKLSIKYCIRNSIDEMYLTHYTKEEDYLVKLLLDYGFRKVATKMNDEDIYLKRLVPNIDVKSFSPTEIGHRFYPTFYDGVTVRKFIVPIIPKYHDRLFADCPKPRQTTLNEHRGEFIVEGNTISKAYLCQANVRKISKGDILLFYRSRDWKELTAIGTLDEAYRSKDPEKIYTKVKNRTVYTIEEIREMVKKPNPTLVLLFRWNFYLPNPLTFNKLKELLVLSAAPQTITKIIHRKYLQFKKESKLNERYTVN